MRVVITGAAGFIGANLVHHWRRSRPADAIVAYDALTYAGRRESLPQAERAGHFEFVHGDVGDAPRLTAALQGADLVIHLAAESHNDRAVVDPERFLRTNVVGTSTLLEVARHLDLPRLHHVSTDEVFGSLELDTSKRFTEESPYRPRGPYAATKAASDLLVQAWGATYGMRATISNCGNNFGPYQFPEKLIARAIVRLIRGETVPLYGDGRHVRDWIYVADHCTALETVALHGRPGRTYLVGAENERSNTEVIHRLLEEFGRGEESVVSVADRPGHDRRYAIDPRRIQEELGWKAQFHFEAALHETANWYRTHPDWWTPLLAEASATLPTARAVPP